MNHLMYGLPLLVALGALIGLIPMRIPTRAEKDKKPPHFDQVPG